MKAKSYEQLVAEETLIVDATEAIAEVREEWPGGISYGDLAKKSGMSKAHLIRFMRGDGNPTLRTLAKVAHTLGHRVVVTVEPLASDQLQKETTDKESSDDE